MKFPKVRLVMSGPGRGKLFIDDKEIVGVTHISIECGVDQMNRIDVPLAIAEVEVDGVFDVTTIGDDSKTFAKA